MLPSLKDLMKGRFYATLQAIEEHATDDDVAIAVSDFGEVHNINQIRDSEHWRRFILTMQMRAGIALPEHAATLVDKAGTAGHHKETSPCVEKDEESSPSMRGSPMTLRRN